MSSASHKAARYSSTRWHDQSAQQYFSFEDVVLKGLASDGGLFHPDTVPDVRGEYLSWKNLSFADLAFQVIRPFMCSSEISDGDLKSIVDRSYSVFRHPEVVPLISLDASKDLHLLELFHGPTFAFKDVALQFLGNLFEFFLVRRNASLSPGQPRHHLTVIGATSGDTGSAAIYGLRGKKDVSIFIMFPDGKVSPVQEAQMTTVLDANVHNLSIKGTFDDCQDIVKALFADTELNKTHHLAAVNSINWARILAQITYYFSAYFQLLKQNPNLTSNEDVQFVVPTGNFGDVLAGFYAKHMGLPIAKLVIATNENDILHRFWQSGTYSKQYTPPSYAESSGGFAQDGVKAHEEGVKETLSPAMDILVSSNFERLLWELTYQYEKTVVVAEPTDPAPTDYTSSTTAAPDFTATQRAGRKITAHFNSLRKDGTFTVPEPEILHTARHLFTTHRVSDAETTTTIQATYRADGLARPPGYVLDPHTAVGVAASLRQIEQDRHQEQGEEAGREREGNTTNNSLSSTIEQKQQQRQQQNKENTDNTKRRIHTITLATAHPAKFAKAVDVALQGADDAFDFARVLPAEFVGLHDKERRLRMVDPGAGVLDAVRAVIVEEVETEGRR
jgi:threonine synthase